MMKALNDNAHPLESLLQQHCPNGVEFKELGELCEINGGKLNANKAQSKGLYEFFTYDYNNPKFVDNYAWDTEALIICKKDNGENPCRYFNGKFNAFQWMRILHSFKNEANIHYIKYYFNAIFMQFLQTNSINISLPYIAIETIKKFPIPLPPLEIQYKIVEILDAFTELQAELEAELEARLKQYHYYRNKLLSFEELQRRTDMLNGWGLKLVSLGEIGTFTRGNGLTKADFVEVGVPCIHYGQIHTHYHNYTHSTISFVSEEKAKKLKKVASGDIIIVTTSEDLKGVCSFVAWLGDEEIVTGGHTAIFKHNQNAKFIAYWLGTDDFATQKRKIAYGTKVIDVKPKDLCKVQIPLPPLSVQEEIVELLDKFDTLTNDLTSGIPAEIEARKKQYEHYRERLLSFITKD
ncbi:restriction endonuclease subunit S [Campylobacter upsaliensis]|nr:restriction endonuclease subunit S [Campylobacter upsaliensis]